MKQLLIGLVVFCCFKSNHCAGQQKNPFFSEKDSIYIEGKVIGFKPGDGNDFISFLTVDVTGKSKKQSFQISADGSFNISVYQHFAGDITINYKTAFSSIFTRPDSHLQIQIQDSAIEAGKQGNDVFSVKGELSAINNLLFDFQSGIENHAFIQQADLGNKAQSDSAFAAHRIKRLEEEIAFLDSIISIKKIDNTQFINWQKNQLIYSAGKEILLFPFLGKFNKKISESQLLELISSIPVSNPTALYNSAYYDFLNMLVSDFQIIVNINPDYVPVKKEYGNNAVAVNLNQIDKTASGVAREIMYYDLYQSHTNTKTIGSTSEKFASVIQEPFLKTMFKKLADSSENDFKPYHVINRIRDLKVGSELKTKLLAVFEKAAGSNIFIDFWGDWCGPCMMEMPAYPSLIARFENKPLKFIFFSANTTDKSVEHVKEKYQIKAEFINLTNDEVAIVNNIFEFHSYPSHFIVNSEGYVVGNNTKKAEEIERILFK